MIRRLQDHNSFKIWHPPQTSRLLFAKHYTRVKTDMLHYRQIFATPQNYVLPVTQSDSKGEYLICLTAYAFYISTRSQVLLHLMLLLQTLLQFGGFHPWLYPIRTFHSLGIQAAGR